MPDIKIPEKFDLVKTIREFKKHKSKSAKFREIDTFFKVEYEIFPKSVVIRANMNVHEGIRLKTFKEIVDLCDSCGISEFERFLDTDDDGYITLKIRKTM